MDNNYPLAVSHNRETLINKKNECIHNIDNNPNYQTVNKRENAITVYTAGSYITFDYSIVECYLI
jgi:hypothetical protein